MPPPDDSLSGAVYDKVISASAPPVSQVTYVLLLVDLVRGERLWGFSQLVRGPAALRDVPGLRFCKVLGSGQDGGFGLRPSLSRLGLFCEFDDDANARRFIGDSVVAAYRQRSREAFVGRFAAYATRGAWSGHAPAITAGLARPDSGPIAALTRASIRPAAAASFWRHAPPSQDALGTAQGCLLAAGLGEAPVLRQATFSVWDSQASMDAYARGGPHLAAIRASYERGYFAETLFMRFVPLSMHGVYKGRRHQHG